MGIAAEEPPEAHVHGIEHFVDHGIVGEDNGGRVVALDGRVGLRPAHFYDSVLEGYHGFGADEEAESLASAEEGVTFLMICAMVMTGTFMEGTGVSSESMI